MYDAPGTTFSAPVRENLTPMNFATAQFHARPIRYVEYPEPGIILAMIMAGASKMVISAIPTHARISLGNNRMSNRKANS